MLIYPEGRAALAAARRTGRLDDKDHARALTDFEDVVSDLALIGIDEALARNAGTLAEEFELRGYDAMHLATALMLCEDEATLVTWDKDLAEAGIKADLPVAPG